MALGLAPYLAGMRARLFVLGPGESSITADVGAAAAEQPTRIHAVTDSYDEPLAHQLFAGADAFMMPSRFEPCGLAQMQAMAYGTPTIATRVGGLVDTIIDVDDDVKGGTGFLFERTIWPGWSTPPIVLLERFVTHRSGGGFRSEG